MKIIFLDIDGVVNTSGMAQITPDMEFNQTAMMNLKRIAEEADAHIVISSAWRLSGPGTDAYNVLNNNMKAYGLQSRIIGSTGDEPLEFNPNLGSMLGMMRGWDIWSWLAENTEELDVDAFVILDDIPDMGVLSRHLAVCKGEEGIADEVRERAMQVLTMKYDKDEMLMMINQE